MRMIDIARARSHCPATGRSRGTGFTLIEMMIAIVIALIVTGAAIALLVAIIRSNGETINSTRLTQELRAVNEVVAREVRRARYISDPIGSIIPTSEDDEIVEFDSISLHEDGRCIIFGYQLPPPESDAGENEARIIRFDTDGGRVMYGRSTYDGVDPIADGINCNLATVELSSPILEIGGGSGFFRDAATPNRIDIVVDAGLRARSDIPTRSMRSTVFVRSARVRLVAEATP